LRVKAVVVERSQIGIDVLPGLLLDLVACREVLVKSFDADDSSVLENPGPAAPEETGQIRDSEVLLRRPICENGGTQP